MGAMHMSKLEEALEEMGRVLAEALQAHKNSTENCRTAAESLSHTAKRSSSGTMRAVHVPPQSDQTLRTGSAKS